jgi:hypothetical protein
MLENQHSRYGAITRMLPATTGKVFFVIHADNTSDQHLLEEFPVDRDGVPRVYQTIDAAETDQLAIQAALDACVSGRGDYVIILPGSGNDYDLGALLTMSKNDVHLVSFEGLERDPNRIGASRQVVLDQKADVDGIYITGQNCEVAGFYFKNYANKSFVQTGSVAHSFYVHHNLSYCVVSTTMTAPLFDTSTTSGAIYGTYSNNYVTSHSGTAAAIFYAGSSATGTMITKNYLVCGDGATWTVGILNHAYKGVTQFNTVVAITGAGADGTVTTAYNTHGACNHNVANTANTADFTDDGTYMASGNYCGDINHLS